MIFVEKLLKIKPLFYGVYSFVSGAAMVWHLPSCKRKEDAGEIKRNSKFSFRTLWFGAIGLLIVGILSII
jgi:hypothetical protein